MPKPIEEGKVCAHVREFFKGHEVRARVWPAGPMPSLSPSFHVHEVAPGPRTALWSYVSAGGIELSQPESTKLEFLVLAEERNERHIELVTMAAHYHASQCLGEGHTLPIGEPWLPGANCDCLLVCKPYPLGPELEIIDLPGLHGHILWLLPITRAERDYSNEHGYDALEQLFDEAALQYWVPERPSVV